MIYAFKELKENVRTLIRALHILEVEASLFEAWVVVDEAGKAICYLDYSLGDQLEFSKRNYEEKGYQILPIYGIRILKVNSTDPVHTYSTYSFPKDKEENIYDPKN